LAQAQLPPSQLTERCARTLNPLEAFNDTNGFERFIRNCYLRNFDPTDFWIASVAWINAYPNPFQGQGGVGGYAVGQAGPIGAPILQPDWIPKVYMGLVATANPTPPRQMEALRTFRASKGYRALLAARIRIIRDNRTGEPLQAQVSDIIIDGGWTPPFNRNDFLLSYFGGLLGAFNGDRGLQALNDPQYYSGVASIASAVLTTRHPNSALTLPPGERLLVDGLIRFRAGAHTDNVGVAVGSPYHVPWVWNEFAVTYGSGRINVYGLASAFPTTWWYVNGRRVKCELRVGDTSFPTTNMRTIDTSRLNVYPAISIGAPAGNGAAQVADTRPVGVIYNQPYTVGPAQSGGRPDQWKWALGDPPLPAPDVSACGSYSGTGIGGSAN
jgi:hypothetical protein